MREHYIAPICSDDCPSFLRASKSNVGDIILSLEFNFQKISVFERRFFGYFD